MTNEHSKQYIKRSAAVRVVQQYGVGVLDADEFSPEQAERFVISKLNEIPAADVIDGEAYRKLLKTAIDSIEAEIKYRGGTLDYNSGLLRATELLKVLPTACHARWLNNGRNNPPTCSRCGGRALLNYESDYCESTNCPHCGAKMDGTEDKQCKQ